MPVLVLQLLNWDKHRELVARALGHFLDREVEIAEFLDLQLWPTTRLEVKGLRIDSPDESFSKPLLSISDASIEIALTPLFSGLMVFNDFQVKDSVVSLQTNAEGIKNWIFEEQGHASSDPPLAMFAVILNQMQVSHTKLHYSNENQRINRDLWLDTFDIKAIGGSEENRQVVVEGRLNNEPLQIDGSVAVLGNDTVAMSLDLSLGSASGTVRGDVSDLLNGGNANFSLDFSSSDAAQTVKLFVPRLSLLSSEMLDGSATATASLNGRLDNSIRLENIVIDLETDLLNLKANGELDLFSQNSPKLISSAELEVLVKTNNLQPLVHAFGGELLFSGPARAEGILLGSLNDFRVENIELVATSEFVQLEGKGRLEKLGSPEGPSFDLSAKLNTSHIGRALLAYDLKLPVDGSAAASVRVTGMSRDLMVEDINIKLFSPTLNFAASGKIGPMGANTKYDLFFDADTQNLDMLTEFYGFDLPKNFESSATGRLVGGKHDLYLDGLAIGLRSKKTLLQVTGSIGPLGKSAIFKMPFDARTNELSELLEFFGVDSLIAAEVSAKGIVTGTKRDLSIDGLTVDARNNIGRVGVSGAFGLTGTQSDQDLSMEVMIPDLSKLQPFVSYPLGDYSGIRLNAGAEVKRENGRVRLNHISGILSGKGIRVGRFSGQLPDVKNLRSGSLAVDLEMDHLGRLGQSLGLSSDTLVPGRLSISVTGSAKEDAPFLVRVDGRTDSMELSVSGKLTSLDATTDLELKSRFTVTDAQDLANLFQIDLPIDGPLKIQIGIVRDKKIDSKSLKTDIQVEANEIRASADGRLSWPLQVGSYLNAHIETSSLKNLDHWLPGDYLDPGPLSIDGKFVFLPSDQHQADFSARLGNNDLTGTVRVKADLLDRFYGQKELVTPFALTGSFQSSRLNLMEIFPPPVKKEPAVTPRKEIEAAAPASGTNPKKGNSVEEVHAETKNVTVKRSLRRRFLVRNLLSLDWLDSVNVDLEFEAAEFISRSARSENLNAAINIKDKVLRIQADSGEFSGGSFVFDFQIDSQSKPYKSNLKFEINDLVMNEVPSIQDANLPLQGSLDFEAKLSGEGESVKEMVSTARGTILASGEKTYFPSGGFSFLTQSILGTILGFVNPKEKDEFHQVDCGVIGFKVVDGIVMSQDSIALQTEDVTFLIRGGFSLVDESLVFVIRPKARKGAGVSASTFTNFYRLGGTLRDPKIEADLGGVLKTSVTWGLAAATAGLSVIAQGFFDKFMGNQDVCAIADQNYETLIESDDANVQKTWSKLTR